MSSSHTASIMSHLPPELVLAILEFAYFTHMGSPDHTSLANCSLVCTSWSVPAQSLLFRRTTQLRSHMISSFCSALMTSAVRGRFMGHVVRSLDISVGRTLGQSCQPETFVQLLEACHRLYELSISIYGLHEFDQFELAKLKNAGQSIRALNLQSCGVQSPVLFQLLGIWKHVQFLKIGTEIAAPPWRRTGTPGPSVRHPISNTEVSLYELELSRIPQPAVLSWLLSSSASSLRILDLREAPGVHARETLAVHAPHLRSLRLLHFNLDSAAFLRQCRQLEEFAIYNIPVVVPLAPELPPSIEHLSFRNPAYAARNTLRPILDAIDVLPRLRIITCDSNSESLHQFLTLKEKCTQRNVEIVISEVPFWVPEDPVVVHRFPRRRSVSNFGLTSS